MNDKFAVIGIGSLEGTNLPELFLREFLTEEILKKGQQQQI